MNPKYPVYIISKGRADSRLTSRTLEFMNVDYKIVIEPQEYQEYSQVIDKDKILKLPFSNLNQGSIPARNWVWEHSLLQGNKRHWIMDDNIRWFYRFNNNSRIKVNSGTILRCMEDFTDRYDNIAFSGPNYRYFVCERDGSRKPYTLNTRVYSCILVNNNLKYRWRGRYNEDTDICLRALKDGWCTILFNAFLCGKAATLTMKGGNTDNVYIDNDERYKFAESLKKQHSDIVQIVRRYNRWHHEVNYDVFNSNTLKINDKYKIKHGINNYGMKLIIKKYDLC